MCELFCLSSHLPTVATISLQRFAERGGLDHWLIDGWGLALFEGNDVRLYREPEPARDSAWLQFIQSRRIPTRILISHIRHATRGRIALANTQPFVREIAGRMHCFAHNGRLESIERRYAGELARFHPVGETDSEWAACLLFERMAQVWAAPEPPPPAQRLETVARFAAEIRDLGPGNFLYSDGISVFAHGHRRTQSDGSIAAPGLWRLHRSCAIDPDALAAAGVRLESQPQELSLIASVPLTQESWQPLREGEVIVT
ncbi:MAG TPA: class II glutamine amidotransferase [Steroidobacteraceae bacterium]|nr:class II glutamine amidotransferase [Steroidobacteraceae bacterium]